MIDKWLKTLLAIIALFIFLSLSNSQARAENHRGLETDIGSLTDTVNDTILNHELSKECPFLMNHDMIVSQDLT